MNEPIQSFQVVVQVSPSRGYGKRRISVRASDKVSAILQATIALQSEGIDCWSLVEVVNTTN